MGMKVAKFGGSSLADAAQFKKVREILFSDADRRIVVPSAPGKRGATDIKVTDLFYQCNRLAASGSDFAEAFDTIRARYREIARELELTVDLDGYLDEVSRNIQLGAGADYAASRGEYLNGILLADYLGWDFIDPQQGIFFDEEGRLDSGRTQEALGRLLEGHTHAVVPGFYGCDTHGNVKTFSRGGSDITGAIVARAVNADMYENWTDVSGCLMADPRIVRNPEPIRYVTYRELRELSYMGASVLHEDAIFPVRIAGIPTNIRNTNHPDEPGTVICYEAEDYESEYPITGIAGHKDFAIINVEKAMRKSASAAACCKRWRSRGFPLSICPAASTRCAWWCTRARWRAKRRSWCSGFTSSARPTRWRFTPVWRSSRRWDAAWFAPRAFPRGCSTR